MHVMTLVLVEADPEAALQASAAVVESHRQPPDEIRPDTECPCVGTQARQYGAHAAVRKHGTLDRLAKRYRALRQGRTESERQQLPDWTAYSQPWYDSYHAAASAHPSWGQPDARCPQCRGSGRLTAVMALLGGGRLDFGICGGRFTGALDARYDPRLDLANHEPCPDCSPGGARDGGRPRCPRCHGLGMVLQPPLDWRPFDGDVKPVSEVLASSPPGLAPWAVIAPDGVWHQRDVWDDSETEASRWQQEVNQLLMLHRRATAAVWDCHTYEQWGPVRDLEFVAVPAEDDPPSCGAYTCTVPFASAERESGRMAAPLRPPDQAARPVIVMAVERPVPFARLRPGQALDHASGVTIKTTRSGLLYRGAHAADEREAVT